MQSDLSGNVRGVALAHVTDVSAYADVAALDILAEACAVVVGQEADSEAQGCDVVLAAVVTVGDVDVVVDVDV